MQAHEPENLPYPIQAYALLSPFIALGKDAPPRWQFRGTRAYPPFGVGMPCEDNSLPVHHRDARALWKLRFGQFLLQPGQAKRGGNYGPGDASLIEHWIAESHTGHTSGAANHVAACGEFARLNGSLEEVAVGNANAPRSAGCIAYYVAIGEG